MLNIGTVTPGARVPILEKKTGKDKIGQETDGGKQRWSPRGHILKSLDLATKVKFLALRPQVLARGQHHFLNC